ncbi:MAG: helix-turn-helix domain-containing protein [Protaetiibacter sp.]
MTTNTMQVVPHLLTLEHAAKLLALPGARNVRTLIASGSLPVVHVGRYPRVRADDLAAFIDRNTTQHEVP